jgi:cysteinyl-tRNA synthetase
MAKSAGNFTTLSRVTERGYHPLDFRFFCLGAHYRTQLAFTWEALDAARAGRAGLVERVAALKAAPPGGPGETPGAARAYLTAFDEHAADDLNMPRCLADLWTMLRDPDLAPGEKLGAALRMDRILDIGLAEAREEEAVLDAETRALVEERERARRERNWKRADEIRAQLAARGMEIQDGPSGPRVRSPAGQRR